MQLEQCLSDTWKVVLESKCTQCQSVWVLNAICIESVWVLYAICIESVWVLNVICIESFCNHIFISINHNVVLTLSFWTRDDFYQFQNFVQFPLFLFLHQDHKGHKSAKRDWSLRAYMVRSKYYLFSVYTSDHILMQLLMAMEVMSCSPYQ